MYDIFNGIIEPIGSVIKPVGFQLIKRIYKRELDKIVKHYREAVIPAKAQHLLCRIVLTGAGPISYDTDRFMEAIYSRAPYIAKHFNLTSPIHYGRQFKGVFYGEGSTELIIYDDHPFNVAVAEANWQDIRAVRVLDHPISDSALMLPNGKVHSTATGLSIISINLPLLLLQFRCYQLEQRQKLVTESGLLGVEHFIHMHVMPNMLYSHCDIMVLNRLINLYKQVPNSEATSKHPFVVTDYSVKLDRVLDEVLFKLTNAKFNYATYLSNIPSIRMESAFESFQMPDIARTKQVWWTLIAARMKLITFLLNVGGNNGITYNRSLVNRLKIDMKRISTQHTYDAILPPEQAEEYENFIARVADL